MKTPPLAACALLAALVSTAADAAPATGMDAGLAALPGAQAGLRAVSAKSMLGHIKTLASDEFEGRAPGGKGERLTVAYLQKQFKKLGLKPGNPDGSFLQRVPMVGFTSKPSFSYRAGGGQSATLRFPDEFVAVGPATQASVALDKSELLFVGYGVVAPEYGWDDYKGADLRGKTLVMLVNDPPVPDPKDPGKLDPAMFNGMGLTYYGRWTYKYEIAAKMGAAGAIIVHEDKEAGYPYEVVQNSSSRENYDLRSEGADQGRLAVKGWIRSGNARQLFASAGLDFGAMKKAAQSKDFKPVGLGATADFKIQTVSREFPSNNVVAMIEGSDPALKHEYVIYSAHWDHIGIDTSLPGPKRRQVYHGASDNASGVGALLELAKAFKALKTPPKRSLLFIATTAEESGLLGALHYVRNPLVPLRRTLADINMDGMNLWGKTKAIEVVGHGQSTLDDLMAKYAPLQGRTSGPDTRPDYGAFYRADQVEFAKEGVPVLYTKTRGDVIGKPPGYGEEKRRAYGANDYHKVTDDVRADWDLSGMVEDVRLLFLVGYDVAQGEDWPQWRDGSEFKAKRDAALRQ